MIHIPKYTSGLLSRPNRLCALQGDTTACSVLSDIENEYAEALKEQGITCEVYPNLEALNAAENSDQSVMIFDRQLSGHFSPTLRNRGAKSLLAPNASPFWGVAVNPQPLSLSKNYSQRRQNCAHQIGLWFLTNRFLQVGKRDTNPGARDSRLLPWGTMRDNDQIKSIKLEGAHDVVRRLNGGPNFARHMAHSIHAAELPQDSRISWVRVPEKPIGCDMPRLEKFLSAFSQFEQACCRVVKENSEIAADLLAGVELKAPERLKKLYLDPPTDRFSVQRLDLHVTVPRGSNGSTVDVAISENDEMPGGFPDAFHLDNSYGVNSLRWANTFTWLFDSGPVVFLVSNKWSACYIEEIEWLAQKLQRNGFAASVVTTEELTQKLKVEDDGVYLKGTGEKVGTIWRQVPIFEFEHELVDIVELAREGKVRMVPEFSHLGNKAWFALYRRYKASFAKLLTSEVVKILDSIMPESFLVDPSQERLGVAIPVCGEKDEWEARSLSDLHEFTEAERDQYVLKVCGANELSARSYGVFMGHNLPQSAWSEWIRERQKKGETFIVQRRFRTSLLDLPVHHTAVGSAELFRCRMLMRPWRINGKLVSAPVCAVPHTTERVHGMVSMAMVATDLDLIVAAP